MGVVLWGFFLMDSFVGLFRDQEEERGREVVGRRVRGAPAAPRSGCRQVWPATRGRGAGELGRGGGRPNDVEPRGFFRGGLGV